jgi:hypothetical protein
MKNFRLNMRLFLTITTVLIISPYAIAQQGAQLPPAQQPNPQIKINAEAAEKEIRERFAKEINAIVAETQSLSFKDQDAQLQEYIARMKDFFYYKVPVLFKDSDAFKKVNDELRKEYGLQPVKDYIIFFNSDRITEIYGALQRQFPSPGAIDFDNPGAAQKLKQIILDDIGKDKKKLGSPITQAQLESIFAIAQKCTQFTFIHYIMGSEKNNKFECQVNSFFLKVLNEVRRENNLPEVKDDSCVIL